MQDPFFRRTQSILAVLIALAAGALSIQCYVSSGDIYWASGTLQTCSSGTANCYSYYTRIAGIPYYYKNCGTCSSTMSYCAQCNSTDGCNSAARLGLGIAASIAAMLANAVVTACY